MENLNMEALTKEEMNSIKGGGRWVLIEGMWYWVEDLSLDPEG